MAFNTTAGTLIDRTRRYVRDQPDFDTITASLSSGATSVTVADTTLYAKRWPIELDYETMVVRSIDSGTSMTVERAAFGSTAATHASGTKLLIKPSFFAAEIFDALNQAKMATWPYFYREVSDTSITTTDSTYEYTVPNVSGTYNGQTIQIPWVFKVEAKYSGDLTYRELTRWWIVNGATRSLKFRSAEPGGATLRLTGYAPFPEFADTTTVLDAQFPPLGEYWLHRYAAAQLLTSGEAGRARYDSGSVDTREQAMRPGTSMNAAIQMTRVLQMELLQLAMQPIRRRTKRVV